MPEQNGIYINWVMHGTLSACCRDFGFNDDAYRCSLHTQKAHHHIFFCGRGGGGGGE